MSHRFVSGHEKASMKNMWISILCFILVIGIFLFCFSKISDKTDHEAADTLSLAVTRSVVRCYTLEGSYPESLEVLKENYGLSYDEERFVIDYQPLGRNVMPEITILDLEVTP